jgi:hypothetical protein
MEGCTTMSLLDFVLGMCFISNLPVKEKLRLMYDICDDDGDHCMRPLEILIMLQKVERLFCRETSNINLPSIVL